MQGGELDFNAQIDRLIAEMGPMAEGDRVRLLLAADASRQRHDRLRQTVQRLQETLDFLRVSIKYTVFDLEATKRENAYLRKMLDESAGND